MATSEQRGPTEARTKLTGLSRLQTRALAELLTVDELTGVTLGATFAEFAMTVDDAVKLLDTARARWAGDRYSHPYKSTHALVRKLTEERARRQAAVPSVAELAAALSDRLKAAVCTASAPSSRHRSLQVDGSALLFGDVDELIERGLAKRTGSYGVGPVVLTTAGVAVREVLLPKFSERW